MIVKDSDSIDYLLDGDIMREMARPAYTDFYYAFNRTEDIIYDPAYPDDWNIKCYEYDLDEKEEQDYQEFELHIKAGVLTPRLEIGCRRFTGDNLGILANWLGSGNPELKAYIDKRLKEIQEYYDRRNKSCEETSTTQTGN